MLDVSAETEVFKKQPDGDAIIFLTATRVHGSNRCSSDIATRVGQVVHRWGELGWKTSLGAIFSDIAEPMVYETGFAHDVDIAAIFEARSLSAAYDGISELQAAGWGKLFNTIWSVGTREFGPVASRIGRPSASRWALFALWEWNDAWHKATPSERAAYDLECDEAFTADVESGVSIAGRHRLDAQSPWHHLGLWEAPTFEHITRGMLMHEQVADFKFTTSRHFVGRRRSLDSYLEAIT